MADSPFRVPAPDDADDDQRDRALLTANPTALEDGVLRSWTRLEREATDCTKCDLAEGRTNVVFGDGDRHADLMIVGAGPGRHEDLQATPFVGAVGNLVDNSLAAAELTREDCYLVHIVKCRPPSERTPEPVEVRSCLPYLVEQIAHVEPRVILALGSFATRVLVGRRVPIGKVAGFRLDVFDGVTLIPTFHPGSALRGSPQAVAALKRDLRTAKAVLDGELPTGSETVAMARRQTAGT